MTPAGPVPVEVDLGTHRVATTTGPGEASYAAALRLVDPTGPDLPVPLDLSGEVHRYVVDPTVRVAVRPLTHGDLPDVVAWRSAAHVRRWWDAGMETIEAARAKYGPRIEGASRTSVWVWEVNGRSVGFAQDYRIADYPDYALLVPDPEAVGVDYLLGRSEWVGRGIGTRCLWAWALHVRERHPDLRHCFAAPDHRNRASLRVLAKLGFEEGLWFDEPQDDGGVDTVVGCTLDLDRIVGAARGVPH